MKIDVLDTVVLKNDPPSRGLEDGDVGAVVERCGSMGIEVEYVTGAGETRALATLGVDDVREFCASDLPSAGPLYAA